MGTKFNVRSYPEEQGIATTLTEGKVEITIPNLSAKAILKPGDQFVYNKQTHETHQTKIDPVIYAGWKDGILKFNKASFDVFVKRIEEFYQVEIIYQPEDFKGVHFTGSFDNLMISQVFEFVNITVPINYQLKDKQVVLERIKQ